MNEREDFAKMLEDSFKPLNTGDMVTGTVRSVGPTEVTVDLPAKVTGVIPFDEATDDLGTKLVDLYKPGDEITAQAVRVSDVDGIATLSFKKLKRESNWTTIKAGFESGEIFTGKVTEVVRGGVIVASNCVKIFVPAGKTGVRKEDSLDTILGNVVRFRVIDINEERKRAVGSIWDVEKEELRETRREERRKKLEEFWGSIEDGKTYTGTVKSLTDFGAFVDVGGVDGMIHTTELSWTHIKHPSEVVEVGQTVTVFVKSFDKEKKRISLGYRTEETNPWNVFMSKYKEGDTAEVTVVSLMSYGAFAKIVDGVDGLIHISQIADKKIESTASELHIGDVVNVKIIGIDEEKKKVSLSIRALLVPEVTDEPESAEEVLTGDVTAEDAPAEETVSE